MMDTKYTISLRQLIKIFPNLMIFLIPIISTQSLDVLIFSNTKLITTTTIIHHIIVGTIIVDNHMDVIPIQIGKNIVEHVIINGGSRVSIISTNLKP
jgi:hypothetical protein